MGSCKETSLAKWNLEKVVKVVTFTLILVFNLRHGNATAKKLQIFFAGCHYLRQIRQFVKRRKTTIHEIPSELMKFVLKSRGVSSNDLDFNNFAICSDKLFPQSFKHPRWIMVEAKVTRWVAIYPLSIKGMNEKWFSSSQLIKNLSGDTLPCTGEIAVHFYPDSLHEQCACFASSVSIGLINSNESDVDISTKLKTYFSIPRYVQINDVIGLDEATTAFIKSITYPQSNRKNLGCVAQHGITSFYQVASESMLKLPSRLKLKNNSNHTLNSYEDIQKWTICRQPYGLEEECHQMCDIITPFLGLKIPNSLSIPTFLLSGVAGCGKRTVVRNVAASLGLHFIEMSCLGLVGESSKATELRLKNAIQNARQKSPAILYLSGIQVIGKAREGQTPDYRLSRFFAFQMRQVESGPLFIIGSCEDDRQCSPDVYSALLHKIRIDTSSNTKRIDLLRWILEENNLVTDVSLDLLGRLTHGFHFGDLNTMVALAVRRSQKSADSGPLFLARSTLDYAIDAVRQWQSRSMNAPSIPEVRWEDVGGLQDVINELLDTIQLPLKFPELVESGLKRSGILLYGPPGTGKTLLAKAVATECSLHFLSVKGPELLNMYVGQSEENVRNVFEAARQASPCLIFFDELDSLAPNRGRSGDSGGVMDRVVSQLLAELDGINKSAVVFVIGATNRPDLIDPALLRPGRFDKLIYLGVNDSKENQLAVLKALTRKFRLGPDVNLEDVVHQLPACLTGADMYSFCSDAALNSMGRMIKCIKEGHEVDPSDQLLRAADFQEAITRLVPSVSPQDLRSYQRIHNELNKTSEK